MFGVVIVVGVAVEGTGGGGIKLLGDGDRSESGGVGNTA